MYAVAMGVAGAGALASGWAFDRVGLRVLLVVPALTALVPFLSFTTTVAVAWIGAAVWGLGLGVHESTMRAAVAQLAPARRRGAGYGLFTAIYGVAWLAGSTAIGACYAHSVAHRPGVRGDHAGRRAAGVRGAAGRAIAREAGRRAMGRSSR